LTKRSGKAPKNLAILKQLQTHFKAEHEKGIGSPTRSQPLHTRS